MRVSNGWKDYSLIDTSDGKRLEKWGDTILIRPDPSVMWNNVKKSSLWDKADAEYFRSDKGGGRWEVRKPIKEEWEIEYKNPDIKFKVKPTGFKHTGIFPEQSVNWKYIYNSIKSENRNVKVLNLFAYTGGATLAAASAGAQVCHVDAAKGIVNWAKENAALTGLEDAKIRYIVDDCVKFAKREIRRGNKYDAIIMDPPSYGRGPNGEMWRISENISDLLDLSVELLSDNPLFFILNSYSTGLSCETARYLTGIKISSKLGGDVISEEIGIPVEASGFVLPCGATTIWSIK